VALPQTALIDSASSIRHAGLNSNATSRYRCLSSFCFLLLLLLLLRSRKHSRDPRRETRATSDRCKSGSSILRHVNSNDDVRVRASDLITFACDSPSNLLLGPIRPRVHARASTWKEKRDAKERPMNRGTALFPQWRTFCHWDSKRPFRTLYDFQPRRRLCSSFPSPSLLLSFFFFLFSSANCIAWMILHAAISRARGLIASDTSVMDLW